MAGQTLEERVANLMESEGGLNWFISRIGKGGMELVSAAGNGLIWGTLLGVLLWGVTNFGQLSVEHYSGFTFPRTIMSVVVVLGGYYFPGERCSFGSGGQGS